MSGFAPSSVKASIIVALGLITLIGPASIDMYLPFVPAMADELGTQYATMQLTLTVFLLALGGGQLVFGPMIDALGRRIPLLIALVVFSLASILASQAAGLNALLAARLIQGLAASLALVTAMSTVRDIADGVRAAQIFALLMTVQGLGPVIAPAIGGMIGSALGWRAVFIALALLGVVVAVTTALVLRETLPVEHRSVLRVSAVLSGYREIISDRRFVLPGLSLASVFFVLFAYIGGAAHAYQAGYGLSAQSFGFVFGATGLAVLLGAIGSAKLVTRWPVENLSLAGVGAMLAGALIALASSLIGLGLPGIVAGMFVTLAGLGIAEASLMAVALSTRRTALGASAALLGAVPLLLGAAATPLAGAVVEIGPQAWLAFLATGALVATLLTLASTRLVRAGGITVPPHH